MTRAPKPAPERDTSERDEQIRDKPPHDDLAPMCACPCEETCEEAGRCLAGDDHRRRDLSGGLGWVLIGAVAFWGAVIAWGVW